MSYLPSLKVEVAARAALAVGEHCMGMVSALCSLWVWFKRQATWFITKEAALLMDESLCLFYQASPTFKDSQEQRLRLVGSKVFIVDRYREERLRPR